MILKFRSAICAALALTLVSLSLLSCAGPHGSNKRTIVVTYSILGSLVKDLVGDRFEVVVSIPNGLDPHEWEPSARDIEAIDKAALVVENGLGLEGGMTKALDQARKAGVRFFTATDHVMVRTVGQGEGVMPDPGPSSTAGRSPANVTGRSPVTTDQAAGAEDPHIWTDPVTMEAIVDALSEELAADFHVDLSARRADLDARLEALDSSIAASVSTIPADRRELVTGHESMGYFAQRYGFKLIGAVVPSLSTEAEASAAQLVQLKKLIAENRASVVFTELGESPKVAAALASEARVRSVPIVTHALPKDGDYFSFLRDLADTIVGALAK